METLEEKIERVLKDRIELVSYDPSWPDRFEKEKRHLRECLPMELLGRIEHYGSTSIPGMTAKPVVDMLVEVSSIEEAGDRIVPVLDSQGYDSFYRSESDDGQPPFYWWFIKRDDEGNRTHHIHMLDSGFRIWEGLDFRDHLIAHPEIAEQYLVLKKDLASRFAGDRVAYTHGKTEFVRSVMRTIAQDR